VSKGNSLARAGLSQQGLTGGEGSGTQRKRGTRRTKQGEGGGVGKATHQEWQWGRRQATLFGL